MHYPPLILQLHQHLYYSMRCRQMKALRDVAIDNLDQIQRRPAPTLRLRLAFCNIELAVPQNA